MENLNRSEEKALSLKNVKTVIKGLGGAVLLGVLSSGVTKTLMEDSSVYEADSTQYVKDHDYYNGKKMRIRPLVLNDDGIKYVIIDSTEVKDPYFNFVSTDEKVVKCLEDHIDKPVYFIKNADGIDLIDEGGVVLEHVK